MQHDRASSNSVDPRTVGGAWTDGPMADATRLGRHLSDLARSGRDMPRPFAQRRAASITSFVTDHDADFARAALSADRRASLLVRAARLDDVVAWEDWDEVRAIAAGMTVDLGPYLLSAPSPCEPPLAEEPVSRTVRLLWRLGRHRTMDDQPEDRASGGDRPRVPTHSEPDQGD